jgi:cell division protein FtsL
MITLIMIISIIIVLVVLILAVLTTSKAYTYKHSIDPIEQDIPSDMEINKEKEMVSQD